MQLHINAKYPEYFHSTSHRYQNIFRRFKRVSERLKDVLSRNYFPTISFLGL